SYIDIEDIYSIKTPLGLKKIKKIIEKSKPDILHLHHRTSSIEFFVKEIKSNIPMINTVHSSTGSLRLEVVDLVHYIHYKKLAEKLQKYSDFVISVSDYNKEKLIENGLDKNKVTTIRNGINIEDYKVSKKEARKKLRIDENKKIVLFAGRHVREKGLGYLLKAFKKIKEAELIVLGEGPLTEFYKNLYSYENIKFKGRVPNEEVSLYFSAADIFVLPSVYPEPQGVVLMEAMASKTALVATNTGGTPEVIKECKSGLLVEPKSKEQIMKSLKKLIEDNKLRKKFADNGYDNVKRKYTWKKIAKDTEKIYKKVLVE
ncbi:MAG: glycosyltransferase family 4 protein, partial [Candidatus Aenigmarchaeota archaeon]|nr:glycosyltransferase family 4 protein [Candidatus Aenigmarchaeota archaeon]